MLRAVPDFERCSEPSLISRDFFSQEIQSPYLLREQVIPTRNLSLTPEECINLLRSLRAQLSSSILFLEQIERAHNVIDALEQHYLASIFHSERTWVLGLPQGWNLDADDEDIPAPPISVETWARAMQVIRNTYLVIRESTNKDYSIPTVSPSEQGNLVIRWIEPHADLLIKVPACEIEPVQYSLITQDRGEHYGTLPPGKEWIRWAMK